MVVDKPFCIRFSGITIRFIPRAQVRLGKELADLVCEDRIVADAVFELCPMTSPLRPSDPPICNNGTMIYPTQEGWLRIYPSVKNEDGCQVACLLRSDNNNVIYYPASMWDYYTNPLKCAPLMALETILIRHQAMLLHSSVVEVNGQAVLFSGPSGAGKSTQASLWATYAGAQILNGDRCVIMKRDGFFYGGGSPLAGSSNIYRPEQFPIAGIFLLEKTQEISITPISLAALSPLLSQTLVNSWDTAFMTEITTLYQDLLAQVPIYKLQCKPDQHSVRIAYQTLFGKELTS